MAPSNPFICPSFPVLVLISGPSAVGKDTIARGVIKKRPDDFHFVVTATTRGPRAGEVDGLDYIFVSHDEFASMIEQDELLEYAVVYNDYKGVPKKQIQDALASGKNVIMRLDVQGAATVRELIPEAITIFLIAPTEEELVRRLKERKSETAEGINLRVATARKEMDRIDEFDYCIVNADDEQSLAVEQVLNIVDAARCRVGQEPLIL
ncbi:MAG: guanylate kinase [Candidatus Promineifilaceae bacterium]|jgi:guanylate kinase